MNLNPPGKTSKTQIKVWVSKHFSYVYLFLIVILATFLRLYKLDFKSLWLDELYSVVPTNPNNSLAFIIDYCKLDQPPLYFIILHFWFKIFAYTSFYARLLSVVIGIFGVIAMYFLGKEIKSKEIGVFASLLASVNYFLIYYSQESRFYSLLFLLSVLSFIFFIRSLKSKTILNYIAYCVFTISLLYTHYYGILIFFIQGIIFIVYAVLFKPDRRFIISGIFLATIIGCSFLPWLPTLIYDNSISSYWIETPKPYFLVIYYYLYWGKDAVVSVVLLVLALMYLKTFRPALKEKRYHTIEFFTGTLLAVWIILSYLIPYIRSLVSTPVLIPRYTLITFPAIFLIMALGFSLIKQQRIKIIIVVIITLSTVINLFFVRRHYSKIDKAQWREAAHTVIRRYEPGIKVYSNLEWWFNYYFYETEPRLKVTGFYTTNDDTDVSSFLNEIGSEKEFWVLSAEATNNGVTRAQQQYIDTNFKIADSHYFYEASAVLYKRE